MPTILAMRRPRLAIPAPRHSPASLPRPADTVTPPPPLPGEGELHINVSMRNGYTLVHLTGEIDIATVEDLDTTLEDLLHEAEPHLVVDMGDVIFISACGFTSLWQATIRAAHRGGWLRLARVSSRWQRIIDHLRPTFPGRQLAIYETVFAAASGRQLPA